MCALVSWTAHWLCLSLKDFSFGISMHSHVSPPSHKTTKKCHCLAAGLPNLCYAESNRGPDILWVFFFFSNGFCFWADLGVLVSHYWSKCQKPLCLALERTCLCWFCPTFVREHGKLPAIQSIKRWVPEACKSEELGVLYLVPLPTDLTNKVEFCFCFFYSSNFYSLRAHAHECN